MPNYNFCQLLLLISIRVIKLVTSLLRWSTIDNALLVKIHFTSIIVTINQNCITKNIDQCLKNTSWKTIKNIINHFFLPIALKYTKKLIVVNPTMKFKIIYHKVMFAISLLSNWLLNLVILKKKIRLYQD